MNSMVSSISFERFLRRFPWATAGRRESIKQLIDKLTEQKRRVPALPRQPKFVGYVDVSGASRDAIELTEASFKFQSYPPVRVLRSDSEFTASAGEWVCPLRAGDFFHPGALYFLAREIGRSPETDIWYSHEVGVAEGNQPRLITKMAAHWFTLAHSSVMGVPGAVRADLWQPGCLADQALRWSCEKRKVGLVPYYLGYRRNDAVLPSPSSISKSLALTVPVDAVAARGGGYQITLKGKAPLTSVLIAYRNKAESTIRCGKAALGVTADDPVEILFINNQSDPAQQLAIEKAFQGDKRVRFLSFDEPFNYGRMHNAIIHKHANGEILFFLNNDVYLDASFDFPAVVNWAMPSEIGTVGFVLEYEDGRLQSGGFRARFGGLSRLARIGNEQRETGATRTTREVFGSSFAACLVRRETYDKVGGLNELEFANGFGDLVFSLEARRLGFRNIFLGWAKAVHLESASRGRSYEYWEERELERYYAPDIQAMLRESMEDRELRSAKESLHDSFYDLGRLVKDWLGR